MKPSLSIGVLICSYRRPDSLRRGIDALARQSRLPDDVVIVARAGDSATITLIQSWPASLDLPLRLVLVSEPGTVHALNAGLDACRTDLLAITDDDTAPECDWLRRIVEHYERDPALAALGGRDRCHDGTAFDESRAATVGRLQWFGRTIGNHHCGIGPAQEVDFLKGANMSYRRAAIQGLRFERGLRGTGAQAYEDIAFSIAVRRSGARVLYDPRVRVDHYAAVRDEPRHYAGLANQGDLSGLFDHAHNEVVAIWSALTPLGRLAYLVWSALVGTGVSPGLAQALRFTRRLRAGSWRRFATVQRGKLAGLQTARDLRRSPPARHASHDFSQSHVAS